MYRVTARGKLLYCSDLSFYNFSTDSNQLLATIKFLLCWAVNMFAYLTKEDEIAPEEDKVERIQKKNS